jgi:hypothetical protein
MKKTIAILLAVISISSFGQRKSFDSLDSIGFDLNASAKYDPMLATVYNTVAKDLDNDDPFFCDYDEGAFSVKVMKTKVDRSDKEEYYVLFTAGPSADPRFMFYSEDNLDEPAFEIWGLHLIVPGSGNLYVSGHANNMFNTRKKFRIVNGRLQEVKQPYYYVGLQTKTLKPITLFESTDYTFIVGNLPANYEIEVLLYDETKSSFLVRTPFSLLGWINPGYIGQKPEIIDKLFYKGD